MRLLFTVYVFHQTVYCWGSILEKKSWPHSLAAPLNSVAGLCGPAVSGSCPPLVLVLAAPLNSVSRSCPPLELLFVLRAHEHCGWALWPALCPGLVLGHLAPLNSVAGSVSGSCPHLVPKQFPVGVPP